MKQIAASYIRGAPEMSFEILLSYLHIIKMLNLVVDEDQKFKYLLVALGE